MGDSEHPGENSELAPPHHPESEHDRHDREYGVTEKFPFFLRARPEDHHRADQHRDDEQRPRNIRKLVVDPWKQQHAARNHDRRPNEVRLELFNFWEVRCDRGQEPLIGFHFLVSVIASVGQPAMAVVSFGESRFSSLITIAIFRPDSGSVLIAK